MNIFALQTCKSRFFDKTKKINMTNNKIKLHFGIITLLIVVISLTRLLPHVFSDFFYFPPNFAPIAATALFGAAYFSKKYWAFIIPLGAYWISNLLIDNIFYAEYYEGFSLLSNPMIILTFAALVGFGFWALKKVNLVNLIGASLGASVIFFLVTNFTSWVGNPVYPQSIEGLLMSYGAGIPFLKWTVLGDLFYCGVLFGTFEWVKRRSLFTVLQEEEV